MGVNGVTEVTNNIATTYSSTVNAPAEEKKKEPEVKVRSEAAAVYEKSDDSEKASQSVSSKETDRTKIIAQMKADAEVRQQQLLDIVHKMMGKQAKTYGIAKSDEDDSIWKFLAKGDFTVDAATKAQAQEDISEDGYWGVKQTSGRILDFAKALAGDDPAKLEKMRTAFEKGYKMAEDTWGGELPEISKQTFDAVMKGFDELTGKTQE
ncbi:MAG: hypothetical protein K6C96_10470 [Butyrivibrio sp.]|nr:hypothetical protein [Butyrivibrio sp.]